MNTSEKGMRLGIASLYQTFARLPGWSGSDGQPPGVDQRSGEQTANVVVWSAVAKPLADLHALVLDCQATAASPRGHLLELGWCLTQGTTGVRSRLVRLPDGTRVPPAVTRVTGISLSDLREAVQPHDAWRELLNDAALVSQPPVPALIHFARFEQPFLSSLSAGLPPFEVVCTHEIARRMLPDLPRRSLRAIAGYFGRDVGRLRRSASHVEATAFIWRELLPLLQEEGIATWHALREWLATPAAPIMRRRVWPVARDLRLSVPEAPGVYRMHRKGGGVLYVGKACSLHHRVNSYFQKQARIPERTLEMLSQVREITFEVCETPLEAALLEPDEIKRLRPPYNLALVEADRALHFAAPDLSQRAAHPSAACPLGPFSSSELLDEFAALAGGGAAALGAGRFGPNPAVFTAGYERFRSAHREFTREDLSSQGKLLRLGTRLWRNGRRPHDEDEPAEFRLTPSFAPAWTPEQVQLAMEWVALGAALARRRAKWLTRLADATVAWEEPDAARWRFIVIENGEIGDRGNCEPDVSPPVPPGWMRSTFARREAFTLARFDRLKVLTTELKRLVSAGARVAIRVGAGPPLANEHLARVLAWV